MTARQRAVRVVVSVDPVELAHQALFAETARVRNLERLDLEERVEDRVREIQPLHDATRKDAVHCGLEHRPLVLEVEVVDDEEPALVEIVPQAGGLGVARIPVTGFRKIRDRILEQLGVVKRLHVGAVDAHVQDRDVLKNGGQIAFHQRIVGRPSPIPLIRDPHEREPAVVRDGRPDAGSRSKGKEAAELSRSGRRDGHHEQPREPPDGPPLDHAEASHKLPPQGSANATSSGTGSAADGQRDVLLAVEQVRHRRSDRDAGQVHRRDLTAGRLVARDEPRARPSCRRASAR